MSLDTLTAFLQAYHDEVMACEARGLAARDAGDRETFLAEFRAKAQKMERLLTLATPYLEGLEPPLRDRVGHALRRFSNSARCGLELESPFYWTALLWDENARPEDPDTLQSFINSLAPTPRS